MIRFSLSLLFAFTGLASSSSGYDIGFITYAKYMHNKEFHPRKLPNLDLQNIKKERENIFTYFYNFLVAFFLPLFTAKDIKFFFQGLACKIFIFSKESFMVCQ